MALCCIGGVCIPYSAILPLLIVGLQWLLQKMAAAGLLPDAVCQFLQRILPNQTKGDACCSSNECTTTSTETRNVRRGKHSKGGEASTAASSLNNGTVHTIESEDEWTRLLQTVTSGQTNTAPSFIVCKFTAKWCKPCKEISPLFAQLAKSTATQGNNNTNCRFVSIDADDLDEIAATYKVLTLPTFVALGVSTVSNNSIRVVGRYTGSNHTKLEEFVHSVVVQKTE